MSTSPFRDPRAVSQFVVAGPQAVDNLPDSVARRAASLDRGLHGRAAVAAAGTTHDRHLRLMASAAVGGLALLGVSKDVRADGPSPVVHRPATSPPLGRVPFTGSCRTKGCAGVRLLCPCLALARRMPRRIGRPLRTASTVARGMLLRAHSSGFVAAHGQVIEVRPSSRTSTTIGLKRTTSSAASPSAFPPAIAPITVPKPTATAPILQAGIGLPGAAQDDADPKPVAKPVAAADTPATDDADNGSPNNDDRNEIAWRLRHLRRSVLQDTTGEVLDPDEFSLPESNDFGQAARFARSDSSPFRMAANLFTGAPFSGELNFLTTSSFDSPQQLFNGDTFARNVAYISVGAPAGSNAEWAVRGALSQADISAWVIAGTYSSHGPSRHQYDLGLSYATQRYDGGNPAVVARRLTAAGMPARARFDTWTLSPALAITYGARYAATTPREQGSCQPAGFLTLSAGITSASPVGVGDRLPLAPRSFFRLARPESGCRRSAPSLLSLTTDYSILKHDAPRSRRRARSRLQVNRHDSRLSAICRGSAGDAVRR